MIQIIESEIWDAQTEIWKGDEQQQKYYHHRWTNEQGQISPSPSEIQAPKGWEFVGDWKIVMSSGDSMGWEYQFQYLQPPKRRRIWLRSLQRVTTKTTTTTTTTSSQLSRNTRKTLQRIKDDWNFKGYGLSVYKSVIDLESFGIGFRVPFSVNFDFFDRHPEFPSITTSVGLFFPWTVVGYLSASVHVEWIKWVMKSALGLVPRLFLWMLFKLVVPIVYMITSFILFPIKHTLPSLPTKIPEGFWTIDKPQYNPEISERIGCSVSYRWSTKRGYEWRISYSHSYLPTFLVYQNFLSDTKRKLQAFQSTMSTVTRPRRKRKEESAKISPSLISSSDSSSSSTKTTNISTENNNSNAWWQKHFARFGITTGYPVPSPPYFSCSALLSLSGLYFGSRQGSATTTTTSSSSSSSNKLLDATEQVQQHLASSAVDIKDKTNRDDAEYEAAKGTVSSLLPQKITASAQKSPS
jgi:hypothetical protein